MQEIGELGKDLVALHGINISMLSSELNEYMKALKIEEIDIDKVEVTLENMKYLSNIKEYSLTKVNFNEIGSVSSTVTITAWCMAILVLILVVATCCKCCAPCTAVGKGIWLMLKCFFGGIWKLCKCMTKKRKKVEEVVETRPNPPKRKWADQPDRRKKLRKDRRSMSMDKSASASRASMDTVSIGLDNIERVVNWKVLYDKERVMIVSTVDGIYVTFNPCNGKVEDRDGRRYLVSKPEVSVITLGEEIRKSIRPPELIDIL